MAAVQSLLLAAFASIAVKVLGLNAGCCLLFKLLLVTKVMVLSNNFLGLDIFVGL